jgi:hypothetical protein
MEIVGKIVDIFKTKRPIKVFIDVIGIGAGIVDRLNELGYQDSVVAVNVARRSKNPERFINLRAELWQELKEFLLQDLPVQLPDCAELQKDICSVKYQIVDSNGKMKIESKDDIKKRLIKSPDGADAVCLTFYYGHNQSNNDTLYKKPPNNYNSTLC